MVMNFYSLTSLETQKKKTIFHVFTFYLFLQLEIDFVCQFFSWPEQAVFVLVFSILSAQLLGQQSNQSLAHFTLLFNDHHHRDVNFGFDYSIIKFYSLQCFLLPLFFFPLLVSSKIFIFSIGNKLQLINTLLESHFLLHKISHHSVHSVRIKWIHLPKLLWQSLICHSIQLFTGQFDHFLFC